MLYYHHTCVYVIYVYFSQETCDDNLNITMCPLCDGVCDYWRLSTVCSLARASYLFDNGATVLFAIFMSLWGNYTFQYAFLIMLQQVHFNRPAPDRRSGSWFDCIFIYLTRICTL